MLCAYVTVDWVASNSMRVHVREQAKAKDNNKEGVGVGVEGSEHKNSKIQTSAFSRYFFRFEVLFSKENDISADHSLSITNCDLKISTFYYLCVHQS